MACRACFAVLYSTPLVDCWSAPQTRSIPATTLIQRSLSYTDQSQVVRLWGAKYIFRGTIFVFAICLKQICLDTTETEVTKNWKLGGTSPEYPCGDMRNVYYMNEIYTKLRHNYLVICEIEINRKILTLLAAHLK